MHGGDDNDRLQGGNGADILNGDAGDDILQGGNDNDTLNGGSGDDRLDGGNGNDTLNGDADDDVLIGRAGDDDLFGGTGNDTLFDDDGADDLFGGDGNDTLVSGAGADNLNGDDGNDILHGHGLNAAQIRAVLTANPGTVFNAQTNSFYQYVSTNVTHATALADATSTTINGVTGHLVNITSQAENDFIESLTGTNFVWLGATDEAVEGEWRWSHGIEAGIQFWEGGTAGTAIGGTYNNWNGGEPNNSGGNEDAVQIRTGDTWNDIFIGSNSRYVIEWEAGLMLDDNSIDNLNGGIGNDQLYGYGGADVLIGGTGDDIVFGGTGDDNIDGGANNDILVGGADDDTIDGGTGADIIYGDGVADAPASGLLAYYKLDEAAGTTVADSSGNGNTGTYVGGTPAWNTTGGQVNGAIEFVSAADDDAIEVGTWDVQGSGITLAAWINQDTITADARIIAKTSSTASADHDWAIFIDDNASGAEDRLKFRLTTVNGVQENALEGIDMSDYLDTWTHVAVTYDDTSNLITYYINGVAVGTDTHGPGGAVITGSGKTIAIGNNEVSIGGTRGFDGLLDEVRIYEEGLSAAEIATLQSDLTDDGDDTIDGGADDDEIYGGGGIDNILGGTGNDTISGGTGADTVDGGADNDIIQLANGDFAAGESLTGNTGTDNLILTNATTVDFRIGTLATIEDFDGSAGNDDVTIDITVLDDFTTFDMQGGTDDIRTAFSGTLDVTGSTLPTVTNAENGHIFGSTGNDDLTITGAQVDNLVFGAGTINFDGGTDILRLTSTSTNLNTLGATDASILGLEEIDASSAAAGVTIDLNGQSEDFILTGSAQADTLTAGGGNDTINLANGDFDAGESLIGNGGTDELILTNATTVDFTTGTLTTMETLTGSAGVDNVTISGAQLDSFTSMNFNGGADTLFLTTTSAAGLNVMGLSDADIQGLETISGALSAAGLTILLSGQTENFTVLGGNFADDITTGSGDDNITAGAGDDILTGGAGTDTLIGGADNDTFQLANGDFAAGEFLRGDGGTDNILFTNATTVDFTIGTIDSTVENLDGSTGNDNVTYDLTTALNFANIDLAGGTDTQNALFAGTQDVTALGTPTTTNVEIGNLIGSTGNDDLTISGGQIDALVFGTGIIDFDTGTDVLRLTSTSTILNTLGATDASILGLGEIDASTATVVTILLGSQTEDFIITGSTNGDTLTTGSGADTINGGNGDDIITAGAGVDVIDAGANNDTINLANGDFAAGESITGGGGTDTIELTNATTVDFQTGTLNTVENINGSTGNDNVTIGLDQLIGMNSINLLGGTDTLNFFVNGTLDVTASVFPGTLSAEAKNLNGSAGNDDLTITGAQLNTILLSGSSIIDFAGGADTLNLTSTSTDLNTRGLSNAGILNLENVSAASAAAGVTLVLSGQTEAFTLTGSANNDTFTGGSGADTVDMGNGNDTFNLFNGAFVAGESLTGGAGTDTLAFTNATTVDFTTGTLATFETLTGSTGNDIVTISGTQLNAFTTINFNGGTDTLNITATSTGLNGLANGSLTGLENISAAGAAASVTIDLSNQTENFTVTGSNQADILTAGSGDDTILGGTGGDTITGGDGDDDLYGSTVADNAAATTDDGTLNSQYASFDTGLDGYTEFDDVFGTGTGAYSDGVRITTDGGLSNGALEINLGGIDNTTQTNMSTMYQETFNKTSATSNIYVQVSYRIIKAANFESNETTFAFYELDLSAFAIASLTGDGNGGSVMDTGWVTTTLNLGVLASGNHTFSVGGLLTQKTFNDESSTVRFDDVTWIEQTVSAAGTTNTISGGDGLDTLYGSTDTDIFVFENASAFNDIDQIEKFDATEGDAIDLSDILTGFTAGTDNISQFVQLTDSGGNTLIQVDADGTGGFSTIGQINGITGMDEVALYNNGNILV